MPASSPAASEKRAFWKHWTFWFAVLFGLTLVTAVNSGHRAKPDTPAPATTAPILTKTEWKRKASGVARLVGGQLMAETQPFVARMGEPNRTQAVQGKVVWYYICADGKIQLVMFGDPANGAIIADVNEY